jgi:hypothetical protein
MCDGAKQRGILRSKHSGNSIAQSSGGCMEMATIHAHVQIYFIACSNCTPFENKFAESEVRTGAFLKIPTAC